MLDENIEKNALNSYINNIEYLKKNHKKLYDNIVLFEMALNLQEIKERYILEYKDNYFDVYDNIENQYIYNSNSVEYSKKLVENINFNSKDDSFRTFYDYKYENEVVNLSKNISVYSDSVFGNASIVHYVNECLDEHEKLKTIYNYIVFGVVLGIHIPQICIKISPKVLHIVEPSLELFRLSLFVTDYVSISEKSQMHFYISDNETEFKDKFIYNYYKTFFYNHYIKFFIFNSNCKIYIDYIQTFLVSQPHYLYSYNREINSLLRTSKYIKEGFNYFNISKDYSFDYVSKKPVLLLAAGPSLKDNIEFIKIHKNKFIIVAIYSILPFLEENEIIPDIVTQYDEQDEIVMKTIKNINNLDFFKDTIFLFSSHLDHKVINSFNKTNIYVFQAMFEIKKNFNILTSPSIGEITYKLINLIGFRQIYLLGLDMALDPKTNQSHYDKNYAGSINVDVEENSEKGFSFRNSLLKVKGNFQPEINTMPVYKVSINQIDTITKKYKSLYETQIYNLSNGAYFENTKPLMIKDIDTSSFEEIDKNILNNKFKDFFDNNSENFINNEDYNYLTSKINDAKKLKLALDSFKISKNNDINSFKNSLHELHQELYKRYHCNDLQKILSNYFNNTIHYIFHLLNMENLSNHKSHIKKIRELFYLRLNNLTKEYIEILEDTIEKDKKPKSE